MGGYHSQYHGNHGQIMQGVPPHMEYFYSLPQGSYNSYGGHLPHYSGGQVHVGPGKSSSHSGDKGSLRPASNGERSSA